MSNSFYVCFKNEMTAERVTKLHIEKLRQAARLCDDVIEIVKRFDGKVLNVKLEKTLEKETGEHISVGYNGIMAHYYRDFHMEWWMRERCVPDGDGSGCVTYINPHSFQLCSIYDCTEENSPVIDKRIVAANLIPSIKKQNESLLIDAGKIEDGLKHIAEWKQRTKELTERVNKLHDEIPYEIKEYYGMDIPWSSAY